MGRAPTAACLRKHSLMLVEGGRRGQTLCLHLSVRMSVFVSESMLGTFLQLTKSLVQHLFLKDFKSGQIIVSMLSIKYAPLHAASISYTVKRSVYVMTFTLINPA